MSKHLTTITLNAAIDKTYFVPSLVAGQANRASRTIAQAGGKGINVARVAHTLGEPVVATGFVAGPNGQFISGGLAREGIAQQLVEASSGESRTCLNIIDESNGDSLEVLEAGLQITGEDCERMIAKVRELAAASSVIIMSGSIPAGGSSDLYRRIIEAVKPSGVPVILDTSGDSLAAGIEAAPFMIKPNKEEITRLIASSSLAPEGMGNSPETGGINNANGDAKRITEEERLLQMIRHLMESKQIRCVAVSLGEQGAMVGFEGRVYKVSAAKVEAINPVGSGDSFVAGFAVALHRGEGIEAALKLASACGASNSCHEAAGVVQPDDVARLAAEIEVRQIG